jgi:hypothetical protein
LAPAQVVGSGTVDPSRSLAPFLIVVDPSGNVVASGARLDGSAPVPPKGVLDAAARLGEELVTWQPRPGVRIASAEVPIDKGRKGFVVAGRSLRVVEEREDELLRLVSADWFGTVLATVRSRRLPRLGEEQALARRRLAARTDEVPDEAVHGRREHDVRGPDGEDP